MENQDENQEETKQEETKNIDPSDDSILNKTLEVVKRQEAANAETKALIERQEVLASNKLLGGETEVPPKVEEKVETDAEYAARVHKEVGM